MAGDWIKIEKSTLKKPEVFRIAEQLGIHHAHAFGLCVEFWSWCDDQLTECNAKGVTEKFVDAIVSHCGFASALLSVGWLQVRSGSLVIPNFDRHLAESAKNRALTAKRVEKSRRYKCNGDSVTKALPEKRREEKILNTEERPPNPQRGDGGELLAAQQFVNEWNLTPGTVHCRTVTDKRVRAFAARIRDPAWVWREALAKFPLKCFGESNDWKPDIDWFLRPDSVLKVIEGKYDWKKEHGNGNPSRSDSGSKNSGRYVSETADEDIGGLVYVKSGQPA